MKVSRPTLMRDIAVSAAGGPLVQYALPAQSAAGELFGFDRAAAISLKSAEETAAAAQQFGQEDYITVLTLQCAPAEVLRA